MNEGFKEILVPEYDAIVRKTFSGTNEKQTYYILLKKFTKNFSSTLLQHVNEDVTLQYLLAAPNSCITGLARKGARSRAHLNTHFKPILVALLFRTLNITKVYLIIGLNLKKPSS